MHKAQTERGNNRASGRHHQHLPHHNTSTLDHKRSTRYQNRADDTMIYSEGSGYAELLHILQSDTAHIGKWFKENRLTVMLKKVGQ